MSRAGSRGPAAVALMLALAWAPRVGAEPKDPTARKHIERGQAAIARDDYDTAIDWYGKALAIEREPKVLYLLGQAEFLRGHCRESVRYFAQVKEFDVGAAVTEAMRPYLAECAERLADEPEPVPEPEPAPAPEPEPEPDDATTAPAITEPPPDAGARPARRWYQDPLGDTLVAVGLLGAAAGGAMLVVAQRRHKGATSYGELEGAVDGIRTLRIAGAATLGVGAALALGGFIRWGLLARKADAGATARLGVRYDGSTAGLVLGGRF